MCETRRTTPFDDVVTTGDNFYDPDGLATRENYFEPEACLISHPGHRWRPTWGNHDSAGATGSVLGAPGRYYAWESGGVEFLMLDSTASHSAAQDRWLEEQLAGSDAEVTIAVFHHPPFTTGLVHAPDATVRRRWVPLFQRYGVDLVLNGHQHLYEHLSAGEVDYVVTGGGGRSLYGCGPRRPSLIVCLSRYHFLLVEVAGRSITVTAVGPSGEILDRFTKSAR